MEKGKKINKDEYNIIKNKTGLMNRNDFTISNIMQKLQLIIYCKITQQKRKKRPF